MEQNKGFLDTMDGSWSKTLSDTYEETTAVNTIFTGIKNDKVYSFNTNSKTWKELFKLEPELDDDYEYTGVIFTIDRELINDAINDEFYKDVDSIEINVSLMGIDIDALQNYELISDEEYERGQPDKDYTDIEIIVSFISFTNEDIEYVTLSIGSQNGPEDYVATNYDPNIIFFNPEFAKYLVETATQEYINETTYLEMTEATKNRMYNLINAVNKQNSEYGKIEISNN